MAVEEGDSLYLLVNRNNDDTFFIVDAGEAIRRGSLQDAATGVPAAEEPLALPGSVSPEE